MQFRFLNKIKSDISSIPFGIKLITSVMVIRAFGWGFVDPFYSMYLYSFCEDYAFVGLLAAVISASALLAIIPLMRLGDKMSETSIISHGELLYFFVLTSFVIAGIYKSLLLLIITLFFAGIAQTLVVVGSEIYIRKHDTIGKSNPFAYYIALEYLGWIIAMLLSAFMIKYYSLNFMFLFVLPSVIVSFFILPKVRDSGIRSLILGIRQYFHSSRDVIGIFQDVKKINTKMIFFLVLAFFDGVIRMFSFVFIPLFGIAINLSMQSIALLMAAMYFPFVLSFFFSEILEKFKRMNVIAVGLFIGGISFILLYFIVHKISIVIFAAFISLSMAIVRPTYNSAITRLTHRRMLGEVTGFSNFVDRLGRIIGPIVTGIIADVYGLPVSFLFIAVISFGLGATSLVLKGYDYFVSPDEPIFQLNK